MVRGSEGRGRGGTILWVQFPTAHPSAPRYMKYLYPYECETRALSSPGELQAAIDSNRREGRRQAYTAVPLFNLAGPTPRGAPGSASSHGPAPTATPNCPGPTQGSASGLPAHACAQLSPSPVKKGEGGGDGWAGKGVVWGLASLRSVHREFQNVGTQMWEALRYESSKI